MKNSKSAKKEIKVPAIKLWWPKRGESVRPTISMTKVTASGILFTCILLSLCSGFIDLVYFSGLSKSKFTIFGNLPVAAGFLYTLISIGLISAKFWCASWLGTINELQTRLKNGGYDWWRNLNKPKLRWHFAHKFLITISIITSISLSVVSVGDAVRKNQNEIKKANEAIVELSELITANNLGKESQRNIIYKTASTNLNSGDKAVEQAAKIWPIIEVYRNERAEFEETGIAFNSKDEIEWKGKTIIPDSYWDKQNSLVQNKIKAAGRTMSINQIRNITSEAILAQTIKNEIENLSKNNSSESLALLDKETRTALETAIQNLEGRFKWPESYGGGTIEFPVNNPSGALTMLKDVKAAYENDNGDVGDSAKMFMLIGPSIENAFKAKTTLENISEKEISTSSFGATEIMIMIFIFIVGVVQEFLISLFTPKATIDRNTLYRFDNYFGPLDVDRFLIGIYMDYLEKGVINQQDFEAKVKKCVAILENSSVDAVIERYSSKGKPQKIVATTTRSKPVFIEEDKPLIKNESERTYSDAVTKEIEEIEKLI